jgi:gamma-glutamylcyclotransferase (GGCT)/AIG2-like uncharacterized protein YtfP
MILFVYGSLRRGLRNHRLLRDLGAEYLAPAWTHGTLVDLGTFPGLHIDAQDFEVVIGELYSIDPDRLEALDRLEGEGQLYRRMRVAVMPSNGLGSTWAQTYVYLHDALPHQSRVPGHTVDWYHYVRTTRPHLLEDLSSVEGG